MRRHAGRAGFSATWVWPLAAVIGVAITVVPRLRWVNIYEDQGVVTGQAMQMAAGQVPYRDFDTAIAPGAIFLYGAYFKLVGATVVHQRLLTGAAMLIGVCLVARIGQRVLPAWWAAAVALIWGVWLPVFQEFSSYHFWSVAFILAMAAALLSARSAQRKSLAFAVAGLAGSGALIMLQSSLPAVIAGVMTAFLLERNLRRSVLPMLVGLGIPGLFVLAALAVLGALPAFINDAVLYNFKVFSASQALPFPWQPGLLHDTSFWEASIGALWAIPMHWLLAVVAPIGVAAGVVAAWWRRGRSLKDLPDSLLIGILAVGMYLSVLLVHMSDQNLWLSAALTLLLVASLIRRMLANTSPRRVVAVAAAAPLVIIYATGLSPLVLGYALVCHTDGTGFLRQVDTPNGSLCVTFDSAPTVAAVLKFTTDHADSVIAFLPTASSLPEITGRVPPVPDTLLIPGVITPEELARVEDAMLSRPVEWVIYYKVDFSKDLPADAALRDASPFAFDQFLDQHYQRADQDGLVLYHLKR